MLHTHIYIYIYIIVKFVLYLDLLGNKVLAKYDKIIFVKNVIQLKKGGKKLLYSFLVWMKFVGLKTHKN